MKVSLAQAHETLQVDEGSSIEVVKSAYKRLAVLHHPDKNGNSAESNTKFKELSEAYQRILNHLERPEPRVERGGMRGMPFGFPFGAGGSFHSTGGGSRFPGYGGFAGDYDDYDDYDYDYDEGRWSDVSGDSEDAAQDARDYFRWMFAEILRGGFASRSSRKAYEAHAHCHEETPEEELERRRAEEEMFKQAQQEREEATRTAKEKQLQEAAARRQQKRAAAAASRSAAEVQAAELAQKRLALVQMRRSEVFAAARRCDADVVKRGIYELNVDSNRGEWLPGGPAAAAKLEAAGIEIKEDKVLSKSQKKRSKAKAKASAATSLRSSSATTASATSPSIGSPPGSDPTSVELNTAPVKSDRASCPASMQHETKKGYNKKKVNHKANKGAEAPLSADFTPPPPPQASPSKSDQINTDPRETLLLIAVALDQNGLYTWLLEHGAVPEERNSGGFTAFHLALLLNNVPLVEHALADLKPDFPRTPHHIASASPDPYYPLPKHHNLLSLALVGGGKDPTKVLGLVRLVLPYVGGREIAKAWKKAEFEQRRRNIKGWKWDSWEEIKWILAERMQELDLEGFAPPEAYQGNRPRV